MADQPLSYGDSFLEVADLELLQDGCWINDKLIDFAYEYYAHCIAILQPLSNILLCNTGAVQIMKEMQGRFYDEESQYSESPQTIMIYVKDAREILADLHLAERKHILLPVNNNNDLSAAGGSHWSLVYFDVQLDAATHFDSADPSNLLPAFRLVNKLRLVIGSDSVEAVQSGQSYQQTNGYDCGMFVISNSRKILQSLRKSTIVPLNLQAAAADMPTMRKDMLQTIEALRDEGTEITNIENTFNLLYDSDTA